MANRNLFSTKKASNLAAAMKSDMTLNNANAPAFKMTDREALAQIATTGFLGDTFYATAQNQLSLVLELSKKIANEKDGTEFLGKLAVYSRQKGYMKDMPALLMSILAVRHPDLYEQIFERVIDNAKMVRNHIQMIRSGEVDGHRSFPSAMRRQIKNWFKNRHSNRIFRDNVGKPSMEDIIKMVHPKPTSKEQEALFSYLLGKKPEDIKGTQFNATVEDLPDIVRSYEQFKLSVLSEESTNVETPDVPFEMITSLPLKDCHWEGIARKAQYQMTLQNLNTFERHGVFKNKELVNLIADRLSNPDLIKSSRLFPYRFMTAYLNTSDLPKNISDAIATAMQHSINNVPKIEGKVKVFVDVSGSMSSPVSNTHEKGKPVSKVQCVSVAALIACSIYAQNTSAEIIPFDTKLHNDFQMKKNESIMKNAARLADFGGGGTNCSLGLQDIVDKKEYVDTVIYVSDYESWKDDYYYGTTAMSKLWKDIKKINPDAKLICIDLTPHTTSQVKKDDSILHVGGFSDVVFDVISQFVQFGRNASSWLRFIDNDVVL